MNSYEKFLKIKKHLDLKSAMEAFIDKDYKKAIDLYSSVLKTDPNDWKVYINRCNCYHNLDQFDDALKDAETVISLNPSQLCGHFRRGVVLLAQKQFRSAEKSFQKALTLDPMDDQSLTKLKETHQLFLKEFGFKDNEIDILLPKFTSCAAISDALISGQLIEMLAKPQTEVTSKVASICLESLQQSLETLETLVNESTVSSNDSFTENESIRRPKADPVFKRSSMSPKANDIIIPKNISTPEPTEAINDLLSLSSQPKLVKTRPVITRSIRT